MSRLFFNLFKRQLEVYEVSTTSCSSGIRHGVFYFRWRRRNYITLLQRSGFWSMVAYAILQEVPLQRRVPASKKADSFCTPFLTTPGSFSWVTGLSILEGHNASPEGMGLCVHDSQLVFSFRHTGLYFSMGSHVILSTILNTDHKVLHLPLYILSIDTTVLNLVRGHHIMRNLIKGS